MKTKKVLILTFISLILISCSGNSSLSSSFMSNSSSVPLSNESSSHKNESSSNKNESSSNKNESSSNKNESSSNKNELSDISSSDENINDSYLVYDNFKNHSDWEIINANPVYDNGLNLSNNDNEEIKLIKKHISLKKDKNYTFILMASGNGTVRVDLLDNGNKNIINGMNTLFNLTADNQEFKFIFTTEKDYENVYINISVNGSINLTQVMLDKINLYGDYEAPTFFGLEDTAIYINSKFDYQRNVEVVDNVDGDLTYKYEVELPSGVEVQENTVTFNQPGEYKFIYSCSDKEDNVAIEERIVTVYETMPSGFDFIKNGSFDNGLDLWYYDAYDGASATFEVIDDNGNNVLKTTITAIPSKGSHQPFPRLLYGKLGSQVITDELIIEKDCSYTLSFKIKGDTDRTFQVVIGEVLDKQDENGKWTYYFAQEPSTYGWGLANRNITTEWQTYTIDFDMALNYTNLNGCIAFCFGDCGDNPQTGTFYLDDVSLVKR